MKITEDIRLRLIKAVDYFGSQTNLEKKAGLKASSISNWLKKGYKTIDHENWMKIEPFLYGDDKPSMPHLKPYLPTDYASKPSPSTFPPSPRPPEGNVSPVSTAVVLDKLELGLLEGFRSLDLDTQIKVVQCVRTGSPVCAVPNDGFSCPSAATPPEPDEAEPTPHAKTA